MHQDRLYSLLLVIPILLLIYLLMQLDRCYFNRFIEKLFRNKPFKIILAAVIIITLFFFDGRHSGLFFLI